MRVLIGLGLRIDGFRVRVRRTLLGAGADTDVSVAPHHLHEG